MTLGRALRGLVLLALVGACAVVMHARALRHPPPGERGPTVHGAFHVHSTLSDGRGTPDQVAQAAAAAGLDFVILSDHNVLARDQLRVVNGVLMVPATEESTAFGHLLSLGASRALTSEEKSAEADPLRAVRALGGVPIAAHPVNLREPWRLWDKASELDGVEVLSFDDLWREAIHRPLTSGLPLAALAWWANPQLALLSLVHREDAALAKADSLEASHPTAYLCSVDAHGLPDYERVLGTLSMYVDGIPRPLGVERADQLLSALAAGHAYCALDSVGSPEGFDFTAVVDRPGPDEVVREGTEGSAAGRELRVLLPAVASRVGAQVHLFRDGREVNLDPRTLRMAVPGPGSYRVEIWARVPGLAGGDHWVPWILSNPIRLR